MTGIVVGQVGCLSRHVRDERHGTRAHLASLPSAGQEEPKKTILHVSGALGVITLDIGGPLFTSYSISKAAPNMLVYKQAKEHPDIPTVAIEPGWLKTSLGGPHAPLEVPVGVAGILKVIPTLTKESSGQFFNHKGERLQW